MVLQSRLPPFLLTRPLLQSRRFATDLRQRFGSDLFIVTSPLMAPVFLKPDLPDERFDAVVFTSETGVSAVRQIEGHAKTLPELAVCVGDRTAKAARGLGFDAVSADGDAEALIALIRSRLSNGRILHLHGLHTQGSVAERLNSAGFETVSVVVYHQTAQPLSEQAAKLLGSEGPVCVPLFSARTARLFSDQALALGCAADLSFAAISPKVIEGLDPQVAGRRRSAPHPTAASLIETVATMFGGS